jgi:hypothetical protein
MSAAFALFFTVVLLVTTAYFLMGGLPLLILQHDTPIDGRFIRRFFEVYYKAALFAAGGACISYGLWGKPLFCLGSGAIAAVVLGIRRSVLPAMERLGAQIQASAPAALAGFRRVHTTALAANLLQLVGLVWGLTQLTF